MRRTTHPQYSSHVPGQPSASNLARNFSTLDLLEMETELSLELCEHEPANEAEAPEQSGRFPVQLALEEDTLDEADFLAVLQGSEDRTQPWELGKTNWAGTGELDLLETADLDDVATSGSLEFEDHDALQVIEIEELGTTDGSDLDLEEEIAPPAILLDEVLVYCRAGERLPRHVVPTGELPRFAPNARRKPLARFEVPAAAKPVARLPAVRLPRFDLDAAAAGARRLPPAGLPRFPMAALKPSTMSTRATFPAVRLPYALRHPARIPCAVAYGRPIYSVR